VDPEEHPYVCQGTPKNSIIGLVRLAHHVNLQMGKFSSDRAIMNYAEEFWNIESYKIK